MLSDRIRHVRPRRRTANFRDPRLAPGGDWDGTPGSGFASAPSDPTRTTAKTAVRLVTVPNQRMVITHQVFVSAFAINDGALDGGIDRVRFHLEGNTLEVTEPTLRTFTRADDSEYLAFGYSANIGRASSANGKAHLYVEAIPADATMQSRVIGPFLYSFGDALFDHDVEVAATPDEITGQRYKTLEAAINWLKAQTPDAARIRITEGGTYLVEENSTNHTFDNWLMIEGAAGVTATLARSSYVGDAANRFFIRSGNVAFRNLTFDMRYITGIHSVPNTPFWADRCTFTNTDPDQEYAKWRGALRANAFLFETPTYFTDCEIEYLPNVFGTEAELCRGNIARDGYADLAGDAKAMLGNVVRGWDSSAWLLGEDAFSVTYDGVEATATLSAPIAQGNTRVLTAEWGANSATLTVGRTEDDWDGTTGNAYWPSDVVDWINDTLAAQDAGWSATLLDDTLAAYYINIDRDDPEFSGGANGNASALEVSVKDVTKTIKCNFDIHADGYQDRVGGLSENVIIAGEDWQIAGQLFFSSSTTPAHDYAVINNVFRFLDTEAEYLSPESQLADDAKSHVILAHNSWIDQRLLLRWDDDLTLDAYCLIANNVAEDIVDVGTSTAPEGVIVGNHLYSGSPANAANTSTGGDADSSESTAPDTITVGLSQEDVLATQLVDPFFQPTATNPPGIGTHRVQTGENIITIGLQYDTSIEVLEQLNPEITFSQCDFGERFGGERCIVFLNAGQTIRVPQPTPTPTLSPTPNGSETPTPTATPTFNAPFASSPSNRAYFRRDELVTLRWTSTGVLGPDDMYRVAVENITSDETYTIETSDLFFVIPREWQSDEPGRYEYAWTIGIVSSDAPDNPRFPTEERRFSWEGLGETDDDS